ncbi:MAG: helix-turn-helix domain-containing protein [Phycisphaerae bacterium]|nr:helix-turn-helix domain-containing protein [Phycisphaerae bacterium]
MDSDIYLLISTEEAAQRLGLCVSSFYQGLSSGRIGPTGVKIGKRRLFDPEELAAWVKAGCPCRRQWMAMKGNGP